MRGPFFNQNRINYDILQKSNFNDVDIAIDKIKLKYDIDIKEKVEGLDIKWIIASINKHYEISIQHHDLIGLTIYAENEQSSAIVTEIANYLSKEVFDQREDIGYTP